ncbi:MAG: hypothetical protein A2X46_11200 [Lentisphaerae bacterium GWF2_57_35]|nr:MAG: hypothetical protein A2X46_11200 [Lentisphaerae bacterium GWF2_57_35]
MHRTLSSFKRYSLCFFLACSVWAVLPAAAGAEDAGLARKRPVWIEHPKTDDSVFMYRIGYASGQASAVSAQQKALAQATQGILDEMLMCSGVDEADRPLLRRRLAITGVEPIPDAVYYESSVAGYFCWIQVSYPLAGKNKLLQEISQAKQEFLKERDAQNERDRRLNDAWRNAKASALQGHAADAFEALREPMEQYGNMTQPDFALEEAQLLLGDLHRDLNDQLAARAQYELVVGTSTAKIWKTQAQQRLAKLPKPPRFWPMYIRLGGKPVAVLCAYQRDNDPRTSFQALHTVIARDLSECKMTETELGSLDSAQMDAFFDKKQIESLCLTAANKGAAVLLAVICRVDSALQGKTQDFAGVKMPTPDSIVEIMVIDPARQKVLYADQFKDRTASQTQSKAAERMASIMINKYLIPKCPAP